MSYSTSYLLALQSVSSIISQGQTPPVPYYRNLCLIGGRGCPAGQLFFLIILLRNRRMPYSHTMPIKSLPKNPLSVSIVATLAGLVLIVFVGVIIASIVSYCSHRREKKRLLIKERAPQQELSFSEPATDCANSDRKMRVFPSRCTPASLSVTQL